MTDRIITALIVAVVVAVVVFAAGFMVAWSIQAGRHDDYVRKQNEMVEAANRENEARQKEIGDAWARNLERLRADNDAYRRCVAAGRCGAVVRDRVLPGGCAAPAAAPGPGAAGAGEDPVPAAAGLAADCAETTLQLNTLQAAVEAQKGY